MESARYRLAKLRAAIILAHPRDVPALTRQEESTLNLVNELTRTPRRSALDELAQRRAERLWET